MCYLQKGHINKKEREHPNTHGEKETKWLTKRLIEIMTGIQRPAHLNLWLRYFASKIKSEKET